MRSPHRNRVTPVGEIVAIELRGAWTGNRGSLHRDGQIVREWASHHWLICTLTWKDRRHEQWLPGRLTWLYFHDEAVAFAAGHRPCAYCRRDAYHAYRDALAVGGGRLGHDQIDRRLHAERLVGGTRRRRTHTVEWSDLPDGAFVLDRDQPALVRGRRVVEWSTEGYGESRRRPASGPAELLTPPATLAVLQAGYPVQIGA